MLYYNPNSKRCLLYLNEKYEIAAYKGHNLLMKRTEITNIYRHRSKYKLAKLTSNPRNKIPLQCLFLNCNVILCKVILLMINYVKL